VDLRRSGRTLVARYGDATLAKPSYDLEAARPSIDIDKIPEGRWGLTSSLAPAPSSLPTWPRSAARRSTCRRSAIRARIAAGAPGLVALPLDAAVLAHSAGPDREFADVRIVDGTGRQVPRLVERRPEPLVVPLRAQPATPVAVALAAGGRTQSIRLSPVPAVRRTARRPHRDRDDGARLPAPRRDRLRALRRRLAAIRRIPRFLVEESTSVGWSRTEGPRRSVTPPGERAAASDATELTLVVDEG
jgi:hypothetical protein